MSSIANPQPELPTAEELVSYLDGELPPEDCRRVEERLAADPEYRQQLHDLDRAWEALDSLPSTRADDDFARTTMELVTVAAEGDTSAITASAAAARWSRVGWWAAAAVAGAILGFVAARALLPDENAALLADLPVIRQVDVLRQIDDVEFLRQLAAVVPPDRLMIDEGAIEDELSRLALAGAESLETRRHWVESLPPEEKAKLAAQAKRFDDLSRIAGEQQRLRALQRDISTAHDDDLQRAVLAYGQWLSRRTAGEREQLREDLQGQPINEQVDRVRQLVRQETAQASRRLSAEDAEKLRKELLAIADERQSMLSREPRRPGDGDRRRRLEGPRGALVILSRELQNDDGDNRIRERLVNQLSPEARAHLDRLGGWRRRLQLWQWVRDSLQQKLGPGELERFIAENHDNKHRQQLLGMPSNEMQAQLERLYFSAELGYGDAGQWWNEFRESGGGPRPPPGQGRPDFRPDGPPRPRD